MPDLSVTEFSVLGVLAESPNHGFALARELSGRGEVGRVYTVRQPLVYRALDRLVEAGMAERMRTEESDSGPQRVIHRVTAQGRHQLNKWLEEPVAHVRDVRIELLLKLTLLQRAGRSPSRLIDEQRRALQPTLDALDDDTTEDHVEIWRRHNARAVGAYLEELAGRHD
jgi:DNA-binding PadR family transcriptional regulator